MASNNNTAAGSNAGMGIEFPPIPVNCEECGAQFDAIDEAHYSRCGVCQALFGRGEPANLATVTDTTQVAAIAPVATLSSLPANTPFTAPTFGAWPTTIAAAPRKRAAESENELFMQQNAPTAKRSRTSQQQATTMQRGQPAQPFSLLSTDPVVLAEQDRLIAELLNRYPYGFVQASQPSAPTAEHSETITTNPQQTTQPGQDNADQDALFDEFLNLPSDSPEETTQPSELPAEHSEVLTTNPEQTTQAGGDDAELSNLPPNDLEETAQPSEFNHMTIPKSPEQATQTYQSDEELLRILSRKE